MGIIVQERNVCDKLFHNTFYIFEFVSISTYKKYAPANSVTEVMLF